jgi:hypothetical protein
MTSLVILPCALMEQAPVIIMMKAGFCISFLSFSFSGIRQQYSGALFWFE